MSDIGRRTIEGLREFTRKLESGEPIQATRVERHETPDGPMHLRTEVVMQGEQNDVVTRLNEAIERLEPVEREAAAGPWRQKFSMAVECADGGGPLSAGGNHKDFNTRNERNALFIAAMRPTDDPAYYTNLLKAARESIWELEEMATQAESERNRFLRERDAARAELERKRGNA